MKHPDLFLPHPDPSPDSVKKKYNPYQFLLIKKIRLILTILQVNCKKPFYRLRWKNYDTLSLFCSNFCKNLSEKLVGQSGGDVAEGGGEPGRQVEVSPGQHRHRGGGQYQVHTVRKNKSSLFNNF